MKESRDESWEGAAPALQPPRHSQNCLVRSCLCSDSSQPSTEQARTWADFSWLYFPPTPSCSLFGLPVWHKPSKLLSCLVMNSAREPTTETFPEISDAAHQLLRDAAPSQHQSKPENGWSQQTAKAWSDPPIAPGRAPCTSGLTWGRDC